MKRAFILLLLLCALPAFAFADRGTPEMIETYTARTAVIRCAGDFVIHDNLLDAALKAGGSEHDFSSMLAEVGAYLGEADFTFTNIDGTVGTEDFVKEHGYMGYPSFSTPSRLLYNLKDAGVDMMTLANNHSVDYFWEGLTSTVTSVDQAGLLHVGAYRTQQEKLTPLIVNVNGINIGFLNYTDSLNKMETHPSQNKKALEYGIDFLDNTDVRADIKRLKDAGAELIVCYIHWGVEYRDTPGNSQLTNAQRLADAGVDVIIGGGPHKVQTARYVTTRDENGRTKQVLCLYSLGNFLSDQRGEGKDCGIIFDFTVTRDEEGHVSVSDPCYRTTWVWRRQSGRGYEYEILFSDVPREKPDGMTQADYERLRESALDTKARMDEGCARLKATDETVISVPGRDADDE